MDIERGSIFARPPPVPYGSLANEASDNSSFDITNSSIPAGPTTQPATDSIDAPTLIASQAREVAAAFEKARRSQVDGQEDVNQNSIKACRSLEDWKRYIDKDWTPDRGSNAQAKERVLLKQPALVATGRAAGTSRVRYAAKQVLEWHMWHRDFFLTIIQLNMAKLVMVVVVAHLISFFFFSGIWYLIWKLNSECLDGIRGYVHCYIFSMVTQQTIGYGNSSPNNCAWAAWVISIQALTGVLLQAATFGILFARISHPQQRSRSIFMSESAVISRRDGILKLMFRIADVKTTQVTEPKVRAFMYSWGNGRHTVEGEFIPVRSEELEVSTIDGLLLLPITIEHTIDERSPLCGHTYDSLEALNAEIVVTFEGCTEMGCPFMARQSYLASEIKWGHQFVRCIQRPHGDNTRYKVDTKKFHEVEPQAGLPAGDMSKISQAVVLRSKRTVPYPILGENTLVLSESMCLTDDAGELCLLFRVGDTYPNQMVDPIVRAYVYRWPTLPDGSQEDFTVEELDVGYDTGRDRLLLWLPMVVKHVIDKNSPLASWRNMSGFLADADSYIAVAVEGYMLSNSQNRMRMRLYNCYNDIRLHHYFCHVVIPPSQFEDRKPRVDWTNFHLTTTGDDPVTAQPKITAALRAITGDGIASNVSVDSTTWPDTTASTADALKDGSDLISIAQSRPSPEHEMSGMTYEGDVLSSLLPQINPDSTFNRRQGLLLTQQGGSSGLPHEGGRSGATRRRSDLQRAGLPAAWRLHGLAKAASDGHVRAAEARQGTNQENV